MGHVTVPGRCGGGGGGTLKVVSPITERTTRTRAGRSMSMIDCARAVGRRENQI